MSERRNWGQIQEALPALRGEVRTGSDLWLLEMPFALD